MSWRSWAVAAGLAAPPLLLTVAVWPESSVAGAAAMDGVEAELAVGDSERGTTNGLSSTDYLITGPGVVRIDVDGPTFDPTLTLLDPDSGEQLDYNDDTNGLNPSLTVELDEGESVRAQVRSLGGPPGGAFTIRVGEPGDEPGGTEGGNGDDPTETTFVVGGEAGEAGEAFEEPLGDEPIVVEEAGITVTLRRDGDMVCLDVESRSSGSGTCSSSLRDLVQPGGFGGSFDGRVSVIELASLVRPEVATASVVFPDGSDQEVRVLALPGRVERVLLGEVRVPGDAFERPGGSGAVLILRDIDGESVEEHPI